MNKQELIKEYEGFREIWNNPGSMPALECFLRDLARLDEPEKPIIPQFVAEWYISTVEAGLDPLTEFTNAILTMGKHDGRNPRYNYDTGLYKWIKETPNAIQIVVNMHQFGYKVKQPLLYTVEIPNPNEIDGTKHVLAKDKNGVVRIAFISFTQLEEVKDFQLTEEEIKQDFEWAWQFAKPVEEN